MVADDSVLFREGLVRLLVDSGFSVPGAVGTASDLLLRVAADVPDVVVVDIRMPPTHTTEGLEAAVTLRRTYPGLGVLVLSQHVESHYAFDLLAGDPVGVGYLLKDRIDDLDVFLDAVRRVGGGGAVIDPIVVSRLLGRQRRDDPLASLTARERDVLALMAEGRSNAAIADQLHVGEKTVETHVARLLAKLGLVPGTADNRRVLAVLTYLRSLDGVPPH